MEANMEEAGRIDLNLVEDPKERDQLIRATERIRKATNRLDNASSDGGSSGKSDTNDLQQD
tara:strand:+ start:38192 stop:38374 length:183 start_codon:yes stop_codon:yes gene_type:complete